MPRRLHLDEALGHAATDKRLEILRRVGACGSISQAARDVGVSYKAAWQALDMLANLAGVPLLEKVVGGTGGGGARLTRAAERLLLVGDEMARSRRRVLDRLAAGGGPSVAALGLRTSMRNQLPGTVQALQSDGPMVQVRLGLAGGATLVARITLESAELLGLSPGEAVVAMCKATAVAVRREARGDIASPGALNQLAGKATRVARGGAGDEVSAQLDTGLQAVGFAPAASGLRAGSRVVMAVEASALVVAVPG